MFTQITTSGSLKAETAALHFRKPNSHSSLMMTLFSHPESRLDLLRQPLVEGGFAIAGSRMFNFGRDEVFFTGLSAKMAQCWY